MFTPKLILANYFLKIVINEFAVIKGVFQTAKLICHTTIIYVTVLQLLIEVSIV